MGILSVGLISSNEISETHAASLEQSNTGSRQNPELEILEGLPCTLEYYKDRDLVFEVGEPSTYLFRVLQGMAFTSRHDEQGHRRIFGLHFPGEIIRLDALNHSIHDTDLVVGVEAVLAVYQKVDLAQALQGSTRACSLVIELLSRQNCALLERLEEVSSRSARQRLARLLLEIGEGLNGRSNAAESSADDRSLPIPQNLLADAIGISHVHVSRLMTSFRQECLIGSGRGIKLLNRAVLEDISDSGRGA